jgi:para-aminobenzoate synthetase
MKRLCLSRNIEAQGPGSGMLAPACDAVDAVAACFPPGSMTGAPKHRTLQIIDELEQEVPRGLYAGSLGWLSLSGAADLSVVIRTLVATKSRVTLGSGGAIVHQSDPGAECREGGRGSSCSA